MKFIDIKTLKDLSLFIRKNPILVYGSDENNKIEIIGNKIIITLNGEVIFSHIFDWETILLVKNEISYIPVDISKFEDLCNPLEADRYEEERLAFWSAYYGRIRLPYFIPTYLLLVCFKGTLPTMFEFGMFYKDTYTIEIDIKDKDILGRKLYYKKEHKNDRCWVGETFSFDKHIVENKLLRYKEWVETDNLLVYDFTTRQLFHRIYKNFGSISRDFCHVLEFDYMGFSSYYNSFLDSQGIDMILSDVPLASYTDTKGGIDFGIIKQEYRHFGNYNIAIKLKFDIDKNSNELTLLSTEQALYIIERINELKKSNNDNIISLTTKHIDEILEFRKIYNMDF